jgi:indole-3-glycerol phosphate synthase
VSRFSQAISEGDGISVIPALHGDVAALAAASESAGAEAIAVTTPEDATAARQASGLPVVVRGPLAVRDGLEGIQASGADAFVLEYEDADGDGVLEALVDDAQDADIDCLLDVRDEEELERALERVDPDIVFITQLGGTSEEALERTLDLLPDVPAGKLVVAESGLVTREQVLALERAGVDALVVRIPASAGFGDAVRELVGGAGV